MDKMKALENPRGSIAYSRASRAIKESGGKAEATDD
jgi:hypothetical protein